MKTKFPRRAALLVAKELCDILKPVTDRLIVAGSLRRRKLEVGDVEILYIPKRGQGIRVDMFTPAKPQNLTDLALDQLLAQGVIAKRQNVKSSEVWGEKNKLAIHAASGIPVDFFSTEANFWFNYLVCRTGGAENNRQIAMAANRKAWTWNPYRAGFSGAVGQFIQVRSERDVFELVGLPYREPWDRL